MPTEDKQPQVRRVPRIHIVGRKNAGKTTLVCDLVAELTSRDLRVATIKHTHHHHELDTPGKDSHRHRESGAAGVGILSPQMSAAFVPSLRDEADMYARFDIMFSECDIILVEGDLHTDAPRVEVWRGVLDEPPYASEDTTIAAVATDDAVDVSCPVCRRSQISEVASLLLELARQ